MSRQHLDHSDFEYIKRWGDRMLRDCINNNNYSGLLRLSERIAYFMMGADLIGDSSEVWLSRRLSEIHYIVAEMKFASEDAEKYFQAEERLIEMLGYITEYYKQNGMSINESCELVLNSECWKIPDSWMNKFKDHLDHLE